MHKNKFLKSLIVLVITGICSAAYAQKTLDEIVKLHITAMGGPEKLSQLKSVKIMAEMNVMNMQIPVTVKLLYRAQRLFRSLITTKDGQ
jgi:hypothetical protein